ncbi:Signal transduction histidine kinase [Desulfonatronum thiosulfatophilum]|uniref:histidine kinase n=1 Tax=Desulfonatronum thiosulfatophilum TaxID=617002 RepID=A0A1G6DDA8_9BACT|nr:HAMP domain-containing sensor histidine kinase [Desulfonatronum thiosulfatophilum]SDB43099.1 Signal transduction histidine kinase [Desulfonatronum thiosulfatophilum]
MADMPLEQALADFIFQDASIIMMVLDREERILKTNAYTENLVGRPLAGIRFTDLLVDFTNSFSVPEAVKSTDPHRLNLPSHTGLPQTFYFHFKEQGDEVLVLGEQNSQEVEHLQQSMVRLNNDFTNLNRQLQKSNAELARLNDLKNQLLGMAAHDMRNPIGAILNLSCFLLDETGQELSPEHLQFLTLIHSSSRFMLSLLDDLLDFAKIEAGKLDLHLQPTDLIELIRKNVALNQVLADRKNIQIHFHHYEKLPPVVMDAMKIEQVLSNLISNAIKFSASGTTIKVNILQSGDHATVSVTDQGPGIPDAELHKLFQPFSKTSVRSTDGEKCTGLGLAIVRKIILGHLGKIWIRSEVGKGSTFFFSLPLP